MKRLAILRHAKSSWDDPGLDDFNRPLNERGWKAARRLGREMEKRKMKFDLVLSSTSARTRETIDGVQRHYDFDAPIKFEQDIYLANKPTLLALVRSLDDKVKAPLIVGHNPGLEMLIADLTEDDDQGFRQRIKGKLPTGALTILELDAKHWSEVGKGRGKIVELILPKELD